jgi:hypothetical protein
MTVWAALDRVAARQHGVVDRAQLLALGRTPAQVKHDLGAGLLVEVHRSVYRMAGVPPSPEGAAFAAVRAAGPGAGASHATAVWLWGPLPEPPERPEIAVPPGRSARLHGVRVHHPDLVLAPRWIRLRRGIPTVDPLLAMLQLGASLPRGAVEDALERGVISGLFSVASLEWVRAELAARGRNGAGVLGAILDDRALGRDRPDGMLEPRMAQLCARFGLERPTFQHVVRDAAGRFVAKVDFAYVDLRAFLEVDGYEVHGTPAAMEADFDRQNRLVALGWVPIRFGWRLLVRRPAAVAAQIDAVLARLRADRPPF